MESPLHSLLFGSIKKFEVKGNQQWNLYNKQTTTTPTPPPPHISRNKIFMIWESFDFLLVKMELILNMQLAIIIIVYKY